MPIQPRITALLSLLLLLGACSSSDEKPNKPPINEFFSTAIHEDGSKRFQYTLSPDRSSENRGKGKPRKGSVSKRANSRPPQGDITKPFMQKLEDKLSETGYCREGYMTLEKNISRGRAILRGECHESATEQDRDNFPNRSYPPKSHHLGLQNSVDTSKPTYQY